MNQKSMTFWACVLIIFVLMIGASAVNASPWKQTEGEITLELPESSETPEKTETGEDEEITLVIEREPEGESAAAEENPAETAEAPEPPEVPVPENPKGSFSSHAMGFYWAPAKNAEY